MATDTVRLGFIGAGAICRDRHLPGLQKIDGIELVAVCNRSEESGRAMADAWNFQDVMTDWQALVVRDDIDAIFIGTWPYKHREMSVAGLAAGKHVFCQARMCMDWDEAVAMCDSARRHPNLVNMICPPPHRIPWERRIHAALANDELGEIRGVSVVSLSGGNLATGPATWRERIELSGIQILTVGIYAETLNAWVGEYATLSATTSTPIGQKTDDAGKPYSIQIPQIVSVHGRLQNGALVAEHHSGVAGAAGQDDLTIFGSKGTIRVDVSTSEIFFAKLGEDLAPMNLSADELDDWQVEEDFIGAVRAARRGESWSVSPDFLEGAKYMRKMQALHESAASGRVVNLDESYPLPS